MLNQTVISLGPARKYSSPEETVIRKDSEKLPAAVPSTVLDPTLSISASDILRLREKFSASTINIGSSETTLPDAVKFEDCSMSENITCISAADLNHLISSASPSFGMDELMFLLTARKIGLDFAIWRAKHFGMQYLRPLQMLQGITL